MAHYYDFKEGKFKGIFHFFWWCAGADHKILRKCTFADHVKYGCLGGIVFATGLMAWIAGGFAIYVVFRPAGNEMDPHPFSFPVCVAASAFGFLWGLMIFNLDRYIVSSSAKGDGTETVTWKELFNALPRLLMATIIALTISAPFETRIFQTEVDAQLQQERENYQKKLNDSTFSKYDREFAEVNKQLEDLNREEAKLDSMRNYMQIQYTEEARIITVGPRAKALKVELDKLEKQLDELHQTQQPRRTDLQNRKNELTKSRDKDKIANENSAKSLDGLMKRIQIAHDLSPTISWLLFGLFLMIEIAPILFKLMIIKSPYDYLKENIEECIIADNGMIKKQMADKDNKIFETISHNWADILAHKNENITEAQKQLSDLLVKKWLDKLRDDVDKNPDKYLPPAT